MPDFDEDFSSIPDMPDADSIRDNLLKTGGPEHWNPYGAGERAPTDFAKLPKSTAEKVIEARMVSGPGPNGTAWQHAVWDHWRREADLEKEHRQLMKQLDDVRGFDPDTGKGLPLIQSPQKRKALAYRLAEIADDLERHNGAAGQSSLDKKLAEAVRIEQARYRRQYIQSEAKRRAQAAALEADIEAAAAGYSKTLPKP